MEAMMNAKEKKQKMIAIVLAAGKGTRMGSDIPKQFLHIYDKPVLYYSLDAFQKHEGIDEIVLVVSDEYKQYCKQEIVNKYSIDKVAAIVDGGAERYDSVIAGLKACVDCQYVLIHDGARPCITETIISRCLVAVEQYDACVVGMPSKDTIKIADENGFVAHTPQRSKVWNVQTPQAFSYTLICDAYEKMCSCGFKGVTDDAMVIELADLAKIRFVEGSYENIKVTTPEDIKILENLLK